MKELNIFGFIGFKRMNRICDFWAAILLMYFKRIQQWGLITVPQVRILLFFEEWCSRKKMSPRVSISFHLKMFRSKVTEVISVYCSDVFCKLENERLNGIFSSVLPEKCFIECLLYRSKDTIEIISSRFVFKALKIHYFTLFCSRRKRQKLTKLEHNNY